MGSIPQHWEISHIKRNCKNITDGAHVSPDLSSEDYPFVSVIDVKNGIIDFDNCLKTSRKSYTQLVKNGCKPPINSVLFSKDGTIGDTCVIKKI